MIELRKMMTLLGTVALAATLVACGNQTDTSKQDDVEKTEAQQEKFPMGKLMTAVNALFNENKTDLNNLSKLEREQQLKDIDQFISEKDNFSLSEAEQKEFDQLVTDKDTAVKMIGFEDKVNGLVAKGEKATKEELDALKKEAEGFQDKADFSKRMTTELTKVDTTLAKVAEAKKKAEEEKKQAELKAKQEAEAKAKAEREAKAKAEASKKQQQAQANTQKKQQVAQQPTQKKQVTQQKPVQKKQQQATTQKKQTTQQQPKNNTTTQKKQQSTTQPKQNTQTTKKPTTQQQPKPQPKPQKKLVKLSGQVGNSGKVFCCGNDAVDPAAAWAKAHWDEWFEKGYNFWRVEPIFYGYDDNYFPVTEETRYTVVFFKGRK